MKINTKKVLRIILKIIRFIIIFLIYSILLSIVRERYLGLSTPLVIIWSFYVMWEIGLFGWIKRRKEGKRRKKKNEED